MCSAVTSTLHRHGGTSPDNLNIRHIHIILLRYPQRNFHHLGEDDEQEHVIHLHVGGFGDPAIEHVAEEINHLELQGIKDHAVAATYLQREDATLTAAEEIAHGHLGEVGQPALTLAVLDRKQDQENTPSPPTVEVQLAQVRR